jgi:hypothetical protein
VTVTIASEQGWSLVGVMGSARITAAGAIALISARGLDTAVRPLAARSLNGAAPSRLTWLGPTRTPAERAQAKVLASGRSSAPLKPLKPVRTKRTPSKPPAKPRRSATRANGVAAKSKAVAKKSKTTKKTVKKTIKKTIKKRPTTKKTTKRRTTQKKGRR